MYRNCITCPLLCPVSLNSSVLRPSLLNGDYMVSYMVPSDRCRKWLIPLTDRLHPQITSVYFFFLVKNNDSKDEFDESHIIYNK